jgi:hypothetical protein
MTALLLAAPAAGADPGAEDFEPERPPASSQFGPPPPRSATVSADLGWLTSGIRGDLALVAGFDFVLRGDAFLLQSGFSGQNSVAAGLRWSAYGLGGFRFAAESDLGLRYFAGGPSLVSAYELRGEVAAGWNIAGAATPYVRFAVRGLLHSSPGWNRWAADEQIGGGVERAFGRSAVGFEVYTVVRPGLPGLGQWRLRVAHAF